jgi:amidase
VLPYGFRDGFDRFMTAWGEGAPVRSLAEVVAVNAADNENRAPYGQRSIEEAAETTMTPAEFLEATGRHQSSAQQSMRVLLARHSVEVLLVPPRFQLFAAAGFPALAVPIGLDANGRPQGVVFTGDFLAEPQLLAVGYALEQSVERLAEPMFDDEQETRIGAIGAPPNTGATAEPPVARDV